MTLLSSISGHRAALALASAIALGSTAYAAEHVTLRTGFEIDCSRSETIDGDRVRLYLLPSSSAATNDPGYMDIAKDAVMQREAFPNPMRPAVLEGTVLRQSAEPTAAEMHRMLSRAGSQHHIDEDLLASVVKAESGGRTFAVSRTGARGLMQLMPGTAAEHGVSDAFRADQNIAGGTAYLDQLLVRYHDNAALALAAYNAGPRAVDKYHGVPPFRETRTYVARVVREFNRRKELAARASRAQLAVAALAMKP